MNHTDRQAFVIALLEEAHGGTAPNGLHLVLTETHAEFAQAIAKNAAYDHCDADMSPNDLVAMFDAMVFFEDRFDGLVAEAVAFYADLRVIGRDVTFATNATAAHLEMILATQLAL